MESSCLLEPPKLGIKIARMDVAHWMGNLTGVRADDRVLSLALIGGSIFAPSHVEVRSWHYLTVDEDTLDFPANFYDVVFLNNVLSEYQEDHRRKLLMSCLRAVKSGGKVISVCPACDDAGELYGLLKPYNFDLTKFENSRLTNKQIAVLKPTQAVFLKSTIHLADRKRLIQYIRDLGFDSVGLEHMWGIPHKFSVNRLMIGLLWQKK